MYEECSSSRRHAELDILDHQLTIDFYDDSRQQLIAEASFEVKADADTQSYISSHPTYCKNAWVVGLFALYDWMWATKILEVRGERIVEAGYLDPQRGLTSIKARFSKVDGDSWLVPLANFANTHIQDQLRALYEEHPEALPDGARLPSIFAELVKRNRERTAEALLKQATNRSQFLSKNGPALTVIVDEAGDPGLRKQDSLYCLSALIIESANLTAMRAEVKKILDLWPNPPAEIHFTKVSQRLQNLVSQRLAAAAQTHARSIRCYAFNKWNFLKHLMRNHIEARRDEETPLNIIWTDLINDGRYASQAALLAKSTERIVVDLALEVCGTDVPSDLIHDRKHRRWMNSALESGFRSGQRISENEAKDFFGVAVPQKWTFSLINSKTEPLLWVSDWISHELLGWFEGHKFSPAFESLRGKLVFSGIEDDLGQMGEASWPGESTSFIYPDIPVELKLAQLLS
jgi:hypothetical protein